MNESFKDASRKLLSFLCGSVVGSVEGINAIRTVTLLTLSEQEVLDTALIRLLQLQRW